MTKKLRRRYFYSRGRFRLFGEPPNGGYIPATIRQIIGGKYWSLAIITRGDAQMPGKGVTR